MGQAPASIVHASCVALDGRGLLILGASGAGKSALALELMAMGCGLVGDDRVVVARVEGRPGEGGDWLRASPAPALRGLVEARGLGILRAPCVGPVRLAAVLDLDAPPAGRLPGEVHWTMADIALPLAAGEGLRAAAVRAWLAGGRHA
ncbi:MAG: HPr kinase/phosphorylase [Paracoccaceae bacterium]